PGVHHGTYREGRWWWHSRGYTPAGVECWNGMRGIDYLVGRPDVDPGRVAVTGISGGGAATFWIAAADERVKVAVPVSGMADLPSYVPNRVINGHCDCMFLYNTFEWPWARIAGLIAPRPLLFVNSDNDAILPIEPRMLRVFPRDADLPADQLNTTIDQHFVPVARVAPPTAEKHDEWKDALQAELRRVVFHALPQRVPPARIMQQDSPDLVRL